MAALARSLLNGYEPPSANSLDGFLLPRRKCTLLIARPLLPSGAPRAAPLGDLSEAGCRTLSRTGRCAPCRPRAECGPFQPLLLNPYLRSSGTPEALPHHHCPPWRSVTMFRRLTQVYVLCRPGDRTYTQTNRRSSNPPPS